MDYISKVSREEATRLNKRPSEDDATRQFEDRIVPFLASAVVLSLLFLFAALACKF